MKIQTKLIALSALFACLVLQTDRLVYADDGDILDIIPAIIAGAKNAGFDQEERYKCKSIEQETLICGNGSGGFVDNYYVIFIDEGLTPAKSSVLITVEGLYGDVLSDEHCQADLIEYQVVQEADVPPYLQGNIPDGKQAVYHRVRVHNGNGNLVVAISQICLR